MSILDKDKSYDGNDIYKETVARLHLQKFEDKFSLVKDYLHYKKMSKLVNTYGRKFIEKHLHPKTGRIHTDYFQIKNTGRVSSTRPNLQNIPARMPGFRESFRPEHPNIFVVADYSQQELRVMADISKDQAMIQFYKESVDPDLHSYTASKVYGVEVSKTKNADLRMVGKVMNFTISYGGGVHKLVDVFKVSAQEGKKLIQSFYQSYKGLKTFFDFKEGQTLKNGYVITDDVTGRRCYIDDFEIFQWCQDYIKYAGLAGRSVHPKIWSTYTKIKAKVRRLSQNYPIQGTSGSMTKLATIFMRNWIQKNSL